MIRSLIVFVSLAFAAGIAIPFAQALAQDGIAQPGDTISGTPRLLAYSHEGEHAGHGAGAADSPIAHGTGIIQTIDSEGRSLTIDHEPIDELGMGAMTMDYAVVGSVDLSGLTEGDPVAFRLKRGRDNSYRVTAICNTQTLGHHCLATGSND